MTKQTRGSNRNGRRGDPNQDVQPWLGWIAALFVVVIVVIAVAMGMQRTGEQRNGAAEVRMTPLVGGMAVPVATETGATVAASEVTPLPQAIAESGSITMVTVITSTGALSETDTFTATGEMTPTESLTVTSEITEEITEGITEEITDTTALTLTEEPTVEATIAPTVEATPTVVASPAATEVITAEATVQATATSTPTSRPTTRPTVTPTVVMRVFAPGDLVVASGGRVDIHADAALDSIVLDSFGTGATLEVLDVSGDFASYPVEVDGHGWARVRAADGLVGWVMTDQVEVQ